MEVVTKSYKLEFSWFNGTDFKGWWAELEQYFEVKEIPPIAYVRKVMLHLEGKALD